MKIDLTAVKGKPTRGDEAFVELGAADLPWRLSSMVYRWIDRDSRVLTERRRQGWKICDVIRDFRDRGCPEDLLPPTHGGGTEIINGDSILGMMPLSKYNARYKAEVLEKIKRRREAGVEIARAEGERAAKELAQRGIKVKGGNVLEEISETESRRDWNSPYDVRTKDKSGQVINKNFQE